MKVVRISDSANEPFVDPEGTRQIMTEPGVMRQSLVPDSNDFIMSVVHFKKGVHSKFHTHTCDQVLIATGGKGIVATEKEEVVVLPGDVVLSPAGEKHWHGAAPDSDFTQIFVLRKDDKTRQLQK